MTAINQCFYLVIPDLAQARGKIQALSFTGASAESFAGELQAALREPSLMQRWRAMQSDPDAADDGLGACDPQASVVAQQADLHTNAKVTTSLSYALLKHRLGLLIGAHWTLRDVHAV